MRAHSHPKPGQNTQTGTRITGRGSARAVMRNSVRWAATPAADTHGARVPRDRMRPSRGLGGKWGGMGGARERHSHACEPLLTTGEWSKFHYRFLFVDYIVRGCTVAAYPVPHEVHTTFLPYSIRTSLLPPSPVSSTGNILLLVPPLPPEKPSNHLKHCAALESLPFLNTV